MFVVLLKGTLALTIEFSGSPYISEGLHRNDWSLDNVTISDGFQLIGRHAFYNSSITSITLPSSIREIMGYAFGATKLTSIEFPEGVSTLYEGALERCSLLTSVYIPKSLVTIEGFCFTECLALRNVTVASGNPKYVFENGFLIDVATTGKMLNMAIDIFTDMVVPDDIAILGPSSLRRLSMTSVRCVGADQVKPYVFSYSFNLQSITFGPTLKECSLLAFEGCLALSDVVIEGNNPYFITANSIMYSVTEKDGAALYFIPAQNKMTSFTIPDEMKTLDVSAFAAVAVKEFTLEGGKTSNNYFSVHNGIVYDKGFTKVIACPQYIEITTMVWPEVSTLTMVGTRAFYGQKNISTIHVPNGVTHIGFQAFATARSITTITFPDTLKTFSNNCMHEVRTTTLKIPKLVTDLCQFMCAWMTALRTVEILGNLKTIGPACFSNDRELRTINFPASLRKIESGAFGSCTALQTPEFREGLEFIGVSAFSSCPGMTGNLTIPSSVHTVSDEAFFMCSGIETVYVVNCNTFVGYRAFFSTEKNVTTVCIATKYFTLETEHTYEKIKSREVFRLAASLLISLDH